MRGNNLLPSSFEGELIKTKMFFIILIAIPILFLAQVCVAQPPIPHAFYGNLKVYGPDGIINAPTGVLVEAIVNESIRGSITITEAGKYGGPAALDPKLIVQGYIVDNTAISFCVNGVKADQTWPFKSGDVTELDLTVKDDVAPVIYNLAPSPEETVGTGTPTIAADYSDVLSGIDTASVVIVVDGLNVTSAATVAISRVSYIPPVALADGSHVVKVSVNDRVGNPATKTWSFTVSVPPAEYVPPAPATLTVDTTPIKANVYVNNVLWGIAPQTKSLNAGTYTVSFGDYLGYLTPPPQTITLVAGEVRIVVGVYIEIPSELVENESQPVDIPFIAAEENKTIVIENVFVTEMTICVKENVKDVRITVQQLTDKPAEIAIGAPSVTYYYLNIVAENMTDADIDVVFINFKVEKAWIIAENVNPTSIVLLRWIPATGEWESLPTVMVDGDDICYFYRAESSGLSIFAITGSAFAPAKFELSNLVIDPTEVGPGETVTISVDVTNVGDLEGTYTVTLKINGIVEATENVTLAGGATKTVTFPPVSKDVEGTYNVEVDGLTWSFKVVTPPAPPRPPWAIVMVLLLTAMVVAIAAFYVRRKLAKRVRRRARRRR